jgi:hypothetical protein
LTRPIGDGVRWSGQCSFYRPSHHFETVAQRRERHAELRRPIGQNFDPTEGFEPHVPSRVAKLLGSGGPIAVLRAVASVVISAFNRVLCRRPSPHVGVEVCERVEPTVTNSNSAPSIVAELLGGRIVAPTLYGSPGIVFGCPRHAMGAFPPLAPARLHSSIKQVVSAHELFVPTLAPTQKWLLPDIQLAPDDSQGAEYGAFGDRHDCSRPLDTGAYRNMMGGATPAPAVLL